MTHPGEREPPEPATTDFIGARDLTHWRSRVGNAVAQRTVAASKSLRARTVASSTSLPYVVLGLVSLLALFCAALATAVSATIYDDVAEKDVPLVSTSPCSTK